MGLRTVQEKTTFNETGGDTTSDHRVPLEVSANRQKKFQAISNIYALHRPRAPGSADSASRV
jgi:hypothetical protein